MFVFNLMLSQSSPLNSPTREATLHDGGQPFVPPSCCVQAAGVLTLKLGSFEAPRHERSGQVLSMDWLPEQPHNIMAIGFYDGVN